MGKINQILGEICSTNFREKLVGIFHIFLHTQAFLVGFPQGFNPLNAVLNPICHLLALGAHHILHVGRIRVNAVAVDKG
jgi:hypothetical protein